MKPPSAIKIVSLFAEKYCSKANCNYRIYISINGSLFRAQMLQCIQVSNKRYYRAENYEVCYGYP